MKSQKDCVTLYPNNETLWEEAENVRYCTNEEKYGMNWDAVPDDISLDKEKCEAYIKEQDERERAIQVF